MTQSSFVRATTPLAAAILVAFASSCSLVPHPGAASTKDKAFIAYWPPPAGSGRLRLAVKDLIDIKGKVTSAGSEYLAKNGPPAKEDAKCLAGARARNVDIVGKTNLTEFAVSVSGMNSYFGTPRNRLDGKHRFIPGGSSSGSAVAVADGRADVSFGTDTAGSIRVPAASCGIFGLKTTYGLISLKGVFPISPGHLDTVGPMAKDVPHLVEGMDLLQPGFESRYRKAIAAKPSARQIKIGRLYLDGTDPAIDKAVDDALAAKHFKVVRLSENFKKQWEQAQKDAITVALGDTWRNDQRYQGKKGVTAKTLATILAGSLQYPDAYNEALSRKAAWQRSLRQVLAKVDFIALPTLQSAPPKVPLFGTSAIFELLNIGRQNTQAVNLAGNPAVAIPIPLPQEKGVVPVTSLQLVGKKFGEAELLNASRLIASKK
ncbi:MAG: Amidase [Verrucomicrobiaceae bacterium]|nr:Amidase [Verrucomicrobiaceae bacterium]